MAGSSQPTPRPEPRTDRKPETGTKTPPASGRPVIFSDWASI